MKFSKYSAIYFLNYSGVFNFIMNDKLKTVLVYLGVIATIYISFRFILPVIFKILGIFLSVIFAVIMWLSIAIVAILLINYLYNLYKNNG